MASCARFPDLHDDWPLLQAALAAAGIEATTAVWNDPAVDWSGVRPGARQRDLGQHPSRRRVPGVGGRAVAAGVPVRNSPATLRWNIDKHYLRDLERAGVADSADAVGGTDPGDRTAAR